MATSAFRSTSRRGASESKASNPHSLRRSHSVSANSRKTYLPSDSANPISSDFSVRRDNPLFWTEEYLTRKNGEVKSCSSCLIDRSSGGSSTSEMRGRSVTRSKGVKNGIGRSLSRVRGRSVSRPHDKVVHENGNELDTATSTNIRGRNKNELRGDEMNRISSVRNLIDRPGGKKSALTMVQGREMEWSEDDNAGSQLSLHISTLEDSLSTGSISEAEEKTVKAVSENLHAFQRNNIKLDMTVDVPQLHQDFVNHAGVEFETGIQREYSIKLLESQERARKLITDLAIEKHRGKELDRILKEITRDPEISRVHKCRRDRRTSAERRRVSKSLSEEARAYFDDCVSLSTFDSSDFSASEEPANSSVGTTVSGGSFSLTKGSPRMTFYGDYGNQPAQKQELPNHCSEDSVRTINSSSFERGTPYEFSFAEKCPKNEDIMSYIKHFEKGTKDLGFINARSHYDADEYSITDQFEDALIDRVLYKSRIESGGLVLCGGGAPSLLPFA